MGRMSVHMYEILRGVRSEVSGESSLHHSNLSAYIGQSRKVADNYLVSMFLDLY